MACHDTTLGRRALALSARITGMLTPETIDAAARTCFEMHRARARYRPLDAALRAAPLDDAYRIQDALHRIMAGAGRGAIAGWKIALTSKAMQQMTGVDQPAAGAIFSTVVHPSPARVDLAAYHHLGVEFEVAVRLADALPPGGKPWTRASVAGHVADCVPAFELVEDGDADYTTLDAFTLVAQNTWNGGVVLGAPAKDWRGVDLETAVTRCWIDDRPAGQGKTGDALGHPFEAVAWLANLLNRRGRTLGAGMIVMTGSSITTKFPAPGDRVRFAVDGLGEVALEAA
jgi:2-keto-4-pentenoate hydratase